VRLRLIVAFIAVALLAALAFQWIINLVLPAFPSLAACRARLVAIRDRPARGVAGRKSSS
jgi:hypothetical protein